MIKNSFFINLLLRILRYLNNMYEKSFIYFAINKISNKALDSCIIGNIYRKLKEGYNNNFAKGSIIIGFIFAVCKKVVKFFKTIYSKISAKNTDSVNYKLFEKFIKPLKNYGIFIQTFFASMFGFFLIRTIIVILGNHSTKSILLNLILSLISLVITFINSDLLVKLINNCIPSKVITWLFK